MRATRQCRGGVTKEIAARNLLQNVSPRCAKRAMAGDVFRERRRHYRRLLKGHPLSSINALRPFTITRPCRYLLTGIEIMHGSDGPHVVIGAFAIPAGDPCIKKRIAERKEHFYVMIEIMLVFEGEELGEHIPVSRRGLGVRTIRPIVGNRFCLVIEISAVL